MEGMKTIHYHNILSTKRLLILQIKWNLKNGSIQVNKIMKNGKHIIYQANPPYPQHPKMAVIHNTQLKQIDNNTQQNQQLKI